MTTATLTRPPTTKAHTARHHTVTDAGLAAGLQYVRFIDRRRRRLETVMGDKLTDLFEDMGRAAARAYLATHPKEAKADAQTIQVLMSDIRMDQIVQSQQVIYQATYEATSDLVWEGMSQVGLLTGIDIGIRDQAAQNILVEGGRRAGLVDMVGQTRNAMFSALAQARAEGLSIPQTANRISEFVSAGPYRNAGARYRATMIARTETRHAANRSQSEIGQRAGFDLYLAFDDRIGFGDAECVARNGQTFTVQEMEDAIGAEHPNGTLSFSPVPESNTEALPPAELQGPDDDGWKGREVRSDNAGRNFVQYDESVNPANMTQKEINAFKSYKDGGYRGLNSNLRNMDGGTDFLAFRPDIPKSAKRLSNMQSAMDSGFAKARGLDRNMLVRRQVNFEGVVTGKPGTYFTDHGYVSTSVRPIRFTQNAHQTIEIRLPKGFRAISSTTGVSDAEMELILPRGTTFRIIGTNRKGHMVLEAILP